ncbi:uncharacterized protein LOC112164308 [Rosa chinensis]|uniref:uncharacterized protein LOC112164308 n=1 Tax=Rosa chinensis TaxID=74649 RepID=UPI000D08DFD3|nr:uncharacterized protein LOC112164308 [Rosa chinensis]
MVKQKGGGAHPPGSGELTNVEFDLQVHKDETTARINALQETLSGYQDSLSSFRTEMLEELRSLRERPSHPTPDPDPDLQTLKFGSLPPNSGSPAMMARLESASSTRGVSSATHIVAASGSISQPQHSLSRSLAHNEVILGFASEFENERAPATTSMNSSNASGIVTSSIHSANVTRGEPSLSKSQPQEQHNQTHYYQHTGFGTQPFNAFGGPYFGHGGGQMGPEPFTMSYSGPYSHSPVNFPNIPPQTTLPFAVPYYQGIQNSTPVNSQAYFFPAHAQPTFATTTTHTPLFNNASTPQQNFVPLQQYPMYPQFQHVQHQHYPVNDPNLPTMKQMKLEFSVFSGGDPVEWLNKVDQYFDFYQIPEDRKLALATMHLSDRAADRWYMFKTEFPNTWMGLSDLLMREFSGHNVVDYQAALARMSQVGSVEQYMDQFTKLSRRAPGFSQQVLLSCFIGGLKDTIRADVKAQKPRTLYEACELAKVYEERELNLRSHSRGMFVHKASQATPRLGNMHTGPVGQLRNHPPAAQNRPPPPPVAANPAGGHRRLTQAEYQERRARNQCFFCDEIFRPGHNCRRGQAMMIMEVMQEEVVVQDPNNLNEGEVVQPPLVEDNDDQEQELQLQMLGDPNNSTMQLKGLCLKKKVHVLVDSGASHNFIHPTLLKNIPAVVKHIKPLRVRLASGDILQTRRQVTIQIQLQGYSCKADYYVLPISGCEVILGAAWLKTLGDIVWNFELMRMKFNSDGKQHVLQGETNTQASVVSCKSMTRLLRKEREAVLVQLQAIHQDNHKQSVQPEIQDLVHKYSEVFENPTHLPPARWHDHKIELFPNTAAINVRPYRYPHSQKEEIEKIINELLDNGIIRPSVSPFSSPVLLVKKKDGTWRLCVDYRALNAATVKDKYPIPVVDELLDEVHGATIFTKLDLRSGYHQIRMDERDIGKTAFRTHSGHYEFLVMPFGMTNAPSTFQSVMNEVLRDFLRKFALVFFDDILVYSQTLEDHLKHLELVFERLQQHSLKVKESKCSFGVPKVEYLGHVISAAGVAVDPTKIECIQQWPQPKTLKELRGFLGLAGYYRKYVKSFGIIAKPLTDMLKKDGFHWTEPAIVAFEKLKQALISTPVLATPDFSKEFVIECDASDLGIGAVLSQDGHPIAYMSKALAQRHLALSVYDKEMLAVVAAVQHWRPYILGHHFKILTDHRTIEHFLNQKITTPAQQKWLLKLLGYDYSIQYKAGKNNAAPDALSRGASLALLSGMSKPIHDYVAEIQKSCEADPEVQNIVLALQQDPTSKKNFSLNHSQLFYKTRMFVPSTDGWRSKIIAEFHEGLLGGHAGRSRTHKRILRSFAWPGIHQDIKRFVSACEVCQRNHYEAIKPPGLLQPLSIPDKAWSSISMDFIDALPKSEGKTAIWVVVDKLTKYAHFIPLSHPYTAASLAKVFVQEVFKLHGMPDNIISDRDPIFLSTFWESFFKLQGTKLSKSSAYHPQSDGQTENLNRTLEQYLRCVTGEKPNQWVQALPWAEWWYNTSHHSAIEMTPFEALYGYPPPAISPYLPGSTAVAHVDQQLRDRDELLQLLKKNLKKAQARMKGFYDKKHSERTFESGDYVYLKLQPYKQHSLQKNSFHKLSARYYGPFQIIEKIGPVAYKLQLPPTAKIHNVFHVSLLKKKLGNAVQVATQLPHICDPTNIKWEPAAVLETRMVKRRGSAATQWLIHWAESLPEDATWEYADDIMHRFPRFDSDA